jgi:hypothetical protein
MPKIEGLQNLLTKLSVREKRAAVEGKASVTVGFTQRYAVFVHEDMEAAHTNGQAKYLEQPARELSNSGELGRLVAETVERLKNKEGALEKGLVVAGLRIQREAQKLTPVDTGALKNSAFTSLTKDEDSAADAALAKSQEFRARKLAARKAKAARSKK